MPNPPSEKKSLKRFSYLISILFFFLVPLVTIFKKEWEHIPKKPFFISFAIIGFLGWAWSWTVTSHVWWSFGENFLLGVEVIPHLPLEELLFYPLGGGLCILFYLYGFKIKIIQNQKIYWTFLIIGNLTFGIIAWATRHNGPAYLYSQLFLYNTICSLALAPWVGKDINLTGLAIPIGILSVVGFIWDYIGFKYGWWVYHAITQIYISVVPLDDFNFFLFAPTAAVSIYVLICKLCNSPQRM